MRGQHSRRLPIGWTTALDLPSAYAIRKRPPISRSTTACSLPQPQSDSKLFKGNTPKFGVDWQITPDILAYVSFTQGFKAGGFNPVPPANSIGGGQTGRPVPITPRTSAATRSAPRLHDARPALQVERGDIPREIQRHAASAVLPGHDDELHDERHRRGRQGHRARADLADRGQLPALWQRVVHDRRVHRTFQVLALHHADRRLLRQPPQGAGPRKWTVGFKYSPHLRFPETLRFNGSWLYHSFFYNNLSNELDLVQAHEASLYNASISWVDQQGRWRVSLEGATSRTSTTSSMRCSRRVPQRPPSPAIPMRHGLTAFV